MHLRLSLRTRFLLASLGLATVLIGGFTLAVQQFLEVLEHGLSMPAFRDEFAQFSRNWEAHPQSLPETLVGYRAYLSRPGDATALPEGLAALAPGTYEEVDVDGLEYAVGRYDHDGSSLFLLRDARYDPVERLEAQLNEIALYALLTAALLSTALALWLVKLVMRPVEALARHAATIVPDAPRTSFTASDDDPAIDLIARAFNATLDRYDDLVERERAFARDASHELRTPLTVILTGIELLESSVVGRPHDAARLARLRAAAEQMEALTEGLLFLARPGAPPPAEPYTASTVLTDAIRIQQMAFGANLAVRLVVRRDTTLTVPRGLLLCVVNNLLRNAVEHGGTGSIELELDGPLLRITDAGPGLPAEAQSSVFEAHVRGEHSSGHGLGLFIVQRICRRLGWTLALASAPGAGTRIELVFERLPSTTETGASQLT